MRIGEMFNVFSLTIQLSPKRHPPPNTLFSNNFPNTCSALIFTNYIDQELMVKLIHPSTNPAIDFLVLAHGETLVLPYTAKHWKRIKRGEIQKVFSIHSLTQEIFLM